MSLSDDLAKVAMDLYVTFETKHESHFTAKLFYLIAKADGGNKARLARGYPLHVALYMEWMDTEDRFEFYSKYGVKHER